MVHTVNEPIDCTTIVGSDGTVFLGGMTAAVIYRYQCEDHPRSSENGALLSLGTYWVASTMSDTLLGYRFDGEMYPNPYNAVYISN